MANNENLRPIKKGELSKEEAARRGSKGGKNSVESKKEKKRFKQAIELALAMVDEASGQDNLTAMTAAIIKQALKGNPKAYELIRDTFGEKPIDIQEVINPEPVIINLNGIKT